MATFRSSPAPRERDHLRLEPLTFNVKVIGAWLGAAMDIDEERRKQAELAKLYDSAQSMATTFQKATLPLSLPNVEGLRFEALYLPSEANMTIGGDWYDAFASSDGSVAISIGDVAGHGARSRGLNGQSPL
jgi:serine phosphatase RsbU (regulator of sigma subunit)